MIIWGGTPGGEQLEAIYEFLSGANPVYVKVYLGVLRYAAPVLVLILLVGLIVRFVIRRCKKKKNK